MKKRILCVLLAAALALGLTLPAAADYFQDGTPQFSGGVARVWPWDTAYMGYDGVVKYLSGWAFINEFVDGVAPVIKASDYDAYFDYYETGPYTFGAVDASGKLLFQIQANELIGFSNGVSPIRINGKWGVIDTSGKLTVPAVMDYNYIRYFFAGVAYVQKTEEMYGYIDKTGKLIISRPYDGNSAGFDYGWNELPIPVQDSGGKWNYYDETGRKVISGDFDYAAVFGEGLAVVGKQSSTGMDLYIINNTGKQVGDVPIGHTIYRDYPFSDGLLSAWDGNEEIDCFLDSTGAVVLRLSNEMNAVDSFHEGLCHVRLTDGNHAFIDKNGKIVLELEDSTNSCITGFHEGHAIYLIYKQDSDDLIGYQVIANPLTNPLTSTDPAPSPTSPFTDISGHWAASAILWAYQNGYVTGTSGTTFSPDETMTRAMMVTILYRAAGSPVVTDSSGFDDVAAGMWYTDAVNWAAKTGVVTGTSDTAFSPDDPITREQLAAILYRCASYMGTGTSARTDLSAFQDAGTVSGWAADGMNWAVAEGLIHGVDANTLNPGGGATRAQVAAILYRFFNGQNESL